MTDAAPDFGRLPSVDRVLTEAISESLLARFARTALTSAIREVLAELRDRMRRGERISEDDLAPAAVAAAAASSLEITLRPRLRPVVNATGVILHTNLGRAVLAPAAIEAAMAAAGACTVEYDLERGARGDRDSLVEGHLCALTGAEAATVVNNNAAAVLLVLNTLAEGREVVVSRGELIEIGGSFRIPELMAKTGARLREVGTTNRTHPHDYEQAIGAETALLMKVHSSNYRIVGFVCSVELAELVALARRHAGLYVVEDLGSGALIDLARFGLPPEPVVADRVAAGADLVTFSGDKLLGGPQCGIVAGRRSLIERLRKNPLKRALRCDKLTLAALEATLRLYRSAPVLEERLPTLRFLARPLAELRELGEIACTRLRARLGDGYRVRLVESSAQAGSGAQPEVPLPSMAIEIRSDTLSPDRLAERFRQAEPPILGRIEKDRFLLDLRTIGSADDLVPA